MARVSTYLNFSNNTEEAFNFYKSVFGTEFEGGINRFGDMPPQEGMPPVSDDIKSLVLHVALPITGGYMLMGSDAPEQMGFKVNMGNNVYINLEPDTREEADRLFNALSAGGAVEMPMADMFWGAYFGSFTDKFGIKWMVNVQNT
ncbi:MAG: VOC family protein [Sphingobacteriales bacterium]|nr:VOC family protein [Sphingobacteriales bacterium]